MSGHSKFANIKHKKEKNDAAKGKIYTKLGREIAVAVKSGGADPSTNNKLRDAIAKAKSNNMPNDNIERCVKKASGDLQNVNYEAIVYEGYGVNGIAVIVSTLTDNKKRTAANVRSAFTKSNGNLGTTGCVSYMFDEKGIIIIEKSDDIYEDELFSLSLDSGAIDFIVQEEYFEVQTDSKELFVVASKLQGNNIEILSQEVTMIPQTYVALTDEKDVKFMNKLLQALEEDDDVQNVWHNWEM